MIEVTDAQLKALAGPNRISLSQDDYWYVRELAKLLLESRERSDKLTHAVMLACRRCHCRGGFLKRDPDDDGLFKPPVPCEACAPYREALEYKP